MLKLATFLICLSICLSIFSGCYRIPGEHEYSLIPSTNNRDLTGEQDTSLIPNVKY